MTKVKNKDKSAHISTRVKNLAIRDKFNLISRIKKTTMSEVLANYIDKYVESNKKLIEKIK